MSSTVQDCLFNKTDTEKSISIKKKLQKAICLNGPLITEVIKTDSLQF